MFVPNILLEKLIQTCMAFAFLTLLSQNYVSCEVCIYCILVGKIYVICLFILPCQIEILIFQL